MRRRISKSCRNNWLDQVHCLLLQLLSMKITLLYTNQLCGYIHPQSASKILERGLLDYETHRIFFPASVTSTLCQRICDSLRCCIKIKG